MSDRVLAEKLESRQMLSATPAVVNPNPVLPSFAAPVAYFTGQSAHYAAVGDFNGDGFDDIAVVNTGGDARSISILINQGNGKYVKTETFRIRFSVDNTILAPANIAVGDFNGDGRLDLAIVTRNADTNAPILGSNNSTNQSGHDGLTILFGNGDGTFGAQTDYRVLRGTRQIQVADLNGDSHPDLVISALGNIGVILNDGTGVFSTQTLYNAGTGNASSVTVGDFSNDGLPDIAVTKGSIGAVRILLNQGNGTFSTGPLYKVAGSPISATAGDFNDDGKLDLAVANNGFRQGITILNGNGDGTFTVGPHRKSSTFLQYITSGDLNGDGNDDLAVVDFFSSVRTLMGIGDGTFTDPKTQRGGTEAFSVDLADVNNDGKLDLVLIRHDTVYIELNTTP